jgi:hypothetical protein
VEGTKFSSKIAQNIVFEELVLKQRKAEPPMEAEWSSEKSRGGKLQRKRGLKLASYVVGNVAALVCKGE